VKQWMGEIDRYACQNVNKILIGNKADLENKRQVDYNEAKEFADSLGIPFFETSAKTAQNIDASFFKCAQDIYLRISEGSGEPTQLSNQKKNRSF